MSRITVNEVVAAEQAGIAQAQATRSVYVYQVPVRL